MGSLRVCASFGGCGRGNKQKKKKEGHSVYENHQLKHVMNFVTCASYC